jgi:hypothetical protein
MTKADSRQQRNSQPNKGAAKVGGGGGGEGGSDSSGNDGNNGSSGGGKVCNIQHCCFNTPVDFYGAIPIIYLYLFPHTWD